MMGQNLERQSEAAILEAITRTIVEKFHPRRIVLFGSRARFGSVSRYPENEFDIGRGTRRCRWSGPPDESVTLSGPCFRTCRPDVGFRGAGTDPEGPHHRKLHILFRLWLPTRLQPGGHLPALRTKGTCSSSFLSRTTPPSGGGRIAARPQKACRRQKPSSCCTAP